MSGSVYLDSRSDFRRASTRRPRLYARKSIALICVISAMVCGLALCVVLRLYRLDMHVPFTYWGDALYFDTWAKGIIEGNWPWHNPRLGMPLGADWRDFPLNITVEALAVRIMAFFTSSPGLVLNLIWLFGTTVCAGFTTYCLWRLGVQKWVAASLGVIYALQPFTFYRGVSHFNLLFYLVPLLATGAVEIAIGVRGRRSGNFKPGGQLRRKRWSAAFGSVPAYVYLACVAQGVSYIYNAFFAIILFAVAALLGYAVSRRKSALIAGLFATVIMCSAVSVNLLPSLLYWTKHGKNPAMAYKSPAQAEVYGLKLRHLLTPIPDNPFPPLRYIENKLDNAGFTGEYENATSRLGTIGSLGLLFLLAWTLISCLHKPRHDDRFTRTLGTCSALTLACVLLATVGGFGSLFNVFVAPDIRCYNRIVVFIDFFSIVAVGLLLTRGVAWCLHHRWPKPMLVGGLAALVIFGVSDQAVTATYRDNAPRERQFQLDAAFVRSVESILPQHATVFQLPFTDFPADGGGTFHMLGYDHSRAYLHSSTLRWSWGGISGRQSGEWVRETSSLPVKDMLIRLSAAGFSGVWIDRFGYGPGASPEREIATVLGGPALLRSDGRIAFYNLRPYTEHLRKSPSPGEIQVLEYNASHPIDITFLAGFYAEEHNDRQTWRWSSQHSVMQISNSLRQPRTATVEMILQAGRPEPETITISVGGHSEAIRIANSTARYVRKILLAPQQTLNLSFDCDCKPVEAANDARNLYFALINPQVVQ